MADKKPWMPNVTMEGVKIVFRNFAGKKGVFNAEGQRNFGVLIDQALADQMAKDGWTIKYLKPREEGDAPQPWVKVKVHYGKGKPPIVVIITSRGRNNLSEDEIAILDWADIENVDLIIRPHQWTIEDTGKEGVTAYLYSIYITIREDALERKYSIVPDSGQGPGNEGSDSVDEESYAR